MTYHRDRTEGSGAVSAFLPAHRSAPAPRIRARRPGRWHQHAALGLIRVDDEGGGGGGGGGGPIRPITATAPMLMPLMSYGAPPSSGISTVPTLGTRAPAGILTAPPAQPATTIRYPLQIGSGIGQPAPIVVPVPPKPARVRPATAEAIVPSGPDMLELESAPRGGSASPAISINRMPLLIAAAGIGLAWYLFRGKGRH